MAPRALIVDEKNQYFTGHYCAKYSPQWDGDDSTSAFTTLPIFDPDPNIAYQYQNPQSAEHALCRLSKYLYPAQMAVIVEPDDTQTSEDNEE